MGTSAKLGRLINDLLASKEPSIRWKVRVGVLGESREDSRVQRLEQVIRRSKRVKTLLSHVDARRGPGTLPGIYYKWQGIHWVLGSLADIGYPRGDSRLDPLMDRVLALWLRPSFQREYVARNRRDASKTH